MVWQPNILNNCYELSGGYAPSNHPPGALLGDFRSPFQILATPLVADLASQTGRPLSGDQEASPDQNMERKCADTIATV